VSFSFVDGICQAITDLLGHFILVSQVVSFDNLEDEELEGHGEEKGVSAFLCFT